MNPIIIRIEDYNKEELVIQYILVIFKNLNWKIFHLNLTIRYQN